MARFESRESRARREEDLINDLNHKLDVDLSLDGTEKDVMHPERPLRTKADYKPEALFVGQILGADGFDNEDALFLEVIFNHGEHWKLLANPPPIQTHSCYPDEDGTFVFAHPFEFYLTSGSIYGWPKFIIKVYRLDDFGKIDAIAYGSLTLPNQAGSFELE